MDSVSAAIVNTASSVAQTSTAQQVSIAVLKKALDLQAVSAAALIQTLPQPTLASGGSLGTLVNTYA